MKQLTEKRVEPLLADNEDLALSGEVSKQSIDNLSKQISKIEPLQSKTALFPCKGNTCPFNLFQLPFTERL
jgi:hypothetical protein